MTDQDWVSDSTILLTEVGSTLHGISAGHDDFDQMGVCLEPLDAAFGLGSPFEQHIIRTAAEREGRADAPSQPGDLDRVVYSLRKWTRLALDGNPTVLLILFAPPEKIVQQDDRGRELRSLAPAFASKRAGVRFQGYLQQQRQRLLGERGQKNVNRRELVDQHGYDTKYAAHMIRLGYQGIEYLETGRITLPMPAHEREVCLSVRRGQMDINVMLTRCGELEQHLADLQTASPLPDQPDIERVERWMLDRYLERWAGAGR